VKALLDVADDKNNAVPRVVVLIRSARNHQTAPEHFGEISPHEPGVKRWWGA
jgi:hypothetical protein